jgi:hypothetical protein
MGTGAVRPQTNRLQWLSRALWALALVGLVYLAGLTVWLGVTGLLFPYQLDYGEGTHLHYVREWSMGRPIYRPIGSYPYITSNYAPLPFLLALALTPVLGITYAAGRIWTSLAVVVIGAVIVAWLRKETGHWLPAVAAALLFVGSPYIYHWAPLFRVDLIGLALTLSGLYVIYLAYPPRGGRTHLAPSPSLAAGTEDPTLAPRPQPTSPPPARGTEGGQKHYLFWLAAVLFVAALYAKQSFIFAPAAACVYLFFFVERRQAIIMAAAVALLGGGVFLLVNTLTSGSFWESMVVANVNPFLWPEFWQQQSDFFGTFAVLSLLTGWYVVDKFILDRTTSLREKISLLDLYLPAALSSALLAGKAGAWENYYFEALAALALCSGLGLARLIRSRKPLLQIAAPLLVVVQVGLMWHTPRVAGRYLHLTRQSYQEMAPILANTPDPIFAEDMGLLVAYDKVLDYHSFEYSQLAQAGRWDQSWELEELRNRRRSLVILDQGTRLDVDRYRRFTREFLSELDRNYRHARTVGKYELYEPDPLQHEQRAEFGEELALVGWSLDTRPALQPGDTVRLIVVWQAQQPMTADYVAFVHLVDEDGQGWAGDDHQPYDGLYPTSAWGGGEMVRDAFTLTVPADAPPGLYDLQVGWYPAAGATAGRATTGERLPVGGGDAFRLAVLPVAWDGTGSESVKPIQARFGQAITLEGYDLQIDPEAIQVTLRWSADGYLDTDYTVFVHLVEADDGDRVLAQGDAPPLGGRWPTSLWLPSVMLDDVHTVPLPADLPPGTYELVVGLYNPATGVRLPRPDGRDALRLTEINLP